MNKIEFIKICSSGGYATEKMAKSYVKNNPKDSYDMEDIICIHRKNRNFTGNHTCGLSYIPNGRTTAFQNA